MAPTRMASGRRLSTEDGERFWYLATQSVYRPVAKRFIVYRLSANDLIVGLSMQALQNGTRDIHATNHPKPIWRTASLQATTLTTAPRIPNPTPVCR